MVKQKTLFSEKAVAVKFFSWNCGSNLPTYLPVSWQLFVLSAPCKFAFVLEAFATRLRESIALEPTIRVFCQFGWVKIDVNIDKISPLLGAIDKICRYVIKSNIKMIFLRHLFEAKTLHMFT